MLDDPGWDPVLEPVWLSLNSIVPSSARDPPERELEEFIEGDESMSIV
jgi:hypothetical protein